jgi:hypothetical protein
MSNIALFSPNKAPAFARNAEITETARALAGGGDIGGVKRVSIKGGVFRLMSAGKEVAAIDERFLDVVIVKAAPKVSRQFYASSYNPDAAATSPDCASANGEVPDVGVPKPQSASCATCPQNQAGSGQGNSRACRYQQRLAVVLADSIDGDVMQLTLPATSIFGKEEGDKRQLQAYVRYLTAMNPPVSPEYIVTRMRFDTKSESPKLHFQPVRWLDETEYETVKEQGQTEDAKRATQSGSETGKAALPAAPTPAAIPAPAPAPKAAKAKAKPVEPEVEETEEETAEPEVRKAAAKPSAVPAAKNKLADIVADWDDE